MHSSARTCRYGIVITVKHLVAGENLLLAFDL